MKNNNLLIGLILLSIIITLHGQNCCLKNIIQTQGLGQSRIKPNIAIIYASVGAQSSTVWNVLKSIKLLLNDVKSELNDIGIATNDIMTVSFTFYPRYNYTDNNTILAGYSSYLSLAITIRGIQNNNQKIGKVIDSLADMGIRSISGITYDTQDPNSGKSNARNNAYKDALNKANQHCQLIGRKLGKAVIIEQKSLSYTPYYYTITPSSLRTIETDTNDYSIKIGSAALAAGSSGDITAEGKLETEKPKQIYVQIPIGMILISLTVTVTWQLI